MGVLNYGLIRGDDFVVDDDEDDDGEEFSFTIAMYNEDFSATHSEAPLGGQTAYVGLSAGSEVNTTRYNFVPRFCTYGIVYGANETDQLAAYDIFDSWMAIVRMTIFLLLSVMTPLRKCGK